MSTVATSSNSKGSFGQIRPITCHLKPTTGLPAAAGFLIADLPIRNSRKSNALNKISVSNRQKKGIFLRSAFTRAAHNPNPAIYNLNPVACFSNRNSQELKIDATQ